jgi:polysaccharide export outer membrane protein
MSYRLAAGVFAQTLLAAGLLHAAPTGDQSGNNYILGIDDQVVIHIVDLPDIPDKPFRVDPSGSVDLPLLGPVHAAGLTPGQFRDAVKNVAVKYISDPQISVNVAQYQSHTVSVVGAVNNPGVHPLAGPKRLIEILSEAGGLRPDAGSEIRITREISQGEIPLPDARKDLSGEFTVAILETDKLMNAGIPRDNIYVRPHDVISVTKADLIYVLGDVNRAGGFPLESRENASVLKAVALAQGLERTAAAKNARILRASVDGGPKKEIPVNIDRILSGKAPDVEMRANDILFVPNNVMRSVALRTAEAALAVSTGIVIYRH